MKDITVSVIIPSYNSHLTIEYTLKHIVNQTCADKILEIIVVDSSDDAATKKLLSDFKSDKIINITSGVRVMPAIQRNMGAKIAKGDLLCFIDSDAFPKSDWIEKIIEAYKSGHKVGGGGYEVPSFQRYNKIAYAQYFIEFSSFIGFGKKRQEAIIASCNLFCDRELFIRVGGFPEVRASEDSLFSLKIGEIEPLIFLPDATVYHIFRENPEHFLSNQRMLGKYVYLFRRKSYQNFYYKGFLPYLFLPAFMLFKFIRIFYRVLLTRKWHNVKYFFMAFSLIIKGLSAWSRGFMDGVKEFHNTSSDL